jgi:hypothetical protein
LNKDFTKQSTILGNNAFMKLNNSFGRPRSSGRYQAMAAAKSSSAALRVRRDLAVQVASIKNGLVREFGMAIGGNGNLLRSALNEAEAIAWQTPYPHLLFPVLAEEKASAVSLWAARQRSVHRASRVMSLAE